MAQDQKNEINSTGPSNSKEAHYYVVLAGLAYKSQSEVEAELYKTGHDVSKIRFFSSNLTAGFIVEKDDVIIVSFRGSSTWRQWLNNCNMWLRRTGSGRVHSGFWSTIEHIGPSILEMILPRLRPGLKLVITGHSRGGALGALFGFMFSRHMSLNNLDAYPLK